MGKVSEFFKNIGLISDEDDDDDYDEYEEDFEEVEEKPKKSFARKKEVVEEEPVSQPAPRAVAKQPARPNKVVPMKGGRGFELCVIKPTSYDDATEITDTLLSGKAVVLNFEGVHVEIAQRIIDFTSGSVYSMEGNLQKITNYIFVVTPPHVDVSGDLQELMAAGNGISLGTNTVKPGLNF